MRQTALLAVAFCVGACGVGTGSTGDPSTVAGDMAVVDFACRGGGDLPWLWPISTVVLDAANAERICDATVVAIAPSGETRALMPTGGANGCYYGGGFLWDNTVKVTHAGYVDASLDVFVARGGDCYPIPQQPTIELTRIALDAGAGG